MRLLIGITVLVAALMLSTDIHAQSEKLMGVVSQRNDRGMEEAVPGANVYWLGTGISTTTAENGVFIIERVPTADRLVISFAGLKPDTITITDQTRLHVELKSEKFLEEVTIEGWKPSSSMDQSRDINTIVMLEEELFKAACCNLSESFETNPSVDVSFTDAVTGSRQIQMLGLSGPNTLISVENMPGVRGLAASQGIQFIPGSWINSIEVTKGVGPVVNGYESIAGQINVELKKPQESEKLFLNAYVNQSGRTEANANFTLMAGKKWATTFLLHGSARPFEMDQNEDTFLDFPLGSQFNIANRWVFNSGTGWLAQFGIKALKDTKLGGQTGFEPEKDKLTTNRYGLEINTSRIEAWGKVGYQFPDKPYKSVGLQLSATGHDHESYFGLTTHDARERTLYSNLIFQSIIGSTNHSYKAGLSFMHSNYDERLLSGLQLIRTLDMEGPKASAIAKFDRREVVPGAFFEYMFDHVDKLSVIAGLRVDHHNLFGTIVTPRLHTRWNVGPTSTLRLSAGKGTRLANLLTENTGILVSSRQLVFHTQTDYGYGFKPDVAWNYGANFSQDFNLDYRPGSLTIDYFYTDFVNQVVLDLDQSAREANFYRLEGSSYSHSMQVQVDYELMRRFDLRIAYRWLDVKTDYRSALLPRPLIAKHRAFANLAYETRNKWKFDYTIQWLGDQRIPNTSMNPTGYQLPATAPDYILMNTQVTRDFGNRWSVYLGIENLNNFTLKNPIISAEEPFSEYFDSSLVWGPIFGRMGYAGFRYKL